MRRGSATSLRRRLGRPRSSHQPSYDLIRYGVGAGLDLLRRLILNGMRYVHRIEPGASQRTGLDTRWSGEFRGRDWYGGYTEVFEMDRIVQTARGTRSSIRQAFYNCIQATQLFDDLRRSVF